MQQTPGSPLLASAYKRMNKVKMMNKADAIEQLAHEVEQQSTMSMMTSACPSAVVYITR